LIQVVVYLPAGENGQKMGFDDFIAQQKAAGKGDAQIRNALLALATIGQSSRTIGSAAKVRIREINVKA
jgi:hypothetical protein